MSPHRLHAPPHARDRLGLIVVRSLLIAPAEDEAKLAVALASGADALVVDLDGAGPPGVKAAARAIAARFLKEARTRAGAPALIVRVSPLSGGETDLDLDAVMPGAPDAVMLPRSLGGASVQQLSAKLAVREAMCGIADGSTRIVALATETAQALFGMASYRGASPRLIGLAWGMESLGAELRAEVQREASGAYAGAFRLARDLTLVAAAAAGVAAIDTMFSDVRDFEGLRIEAERARRDGFSAKLAADPAQVRVIKQAFNRLTPHDA
jgi:citrate lyase subunit beta/citryl-CoA lyase